MRPDFTNLRNRTKITFMATIDSYRSPFPHEELLERARRIRHVALDMDGTIYMGMSLFPWTKRFLSDLTEMGIGYSFLTNNPSKSIADYLHKLDYTFSWIPYYGSRGYDVWQQFGFDQVYLQPNYYWKPQNDMDEVCRQIDSLGIGMEIEFEPTLLDAREGSGTFRARLRDYIDYAKRRNIYGKRPFAYYHGTNGFYDLHASDDEADRELFDELCQFIINNPLRAQRPTTDRK